MAHATGNKTANLAEILFLFKISVIYLTKINPFVGSVFFPFFQVSLKFLGMCFFWALYGGFIKITVGLISVIQLLKSKQLPFFIFELLSE